MTVRRESGPGWWYTERADAGAPQTIEDDWSLDWSILQSPHFVAAILGVLAAQALVAWYVLQEDRREREKKD